MALTMDIFRPKQNANRAGVILVVSGGWFSSHELISTQLSQSIIGELIQRGYTVFAVVHSSQPKFTIPEILPDMQRAIRSIRYHATDYHIDPNHLGIIGASSGGHLALMQGTAGTKGNPQSEDPVERISSRVQAVACFFPPTDFLNYGKPGQDALGRGLLKDFAAPFAFSENSPEKKREIGRQISPINHVTPDDSPTLMIHGSDDPLVPIQQSEIMVTRLKKADVPVQLITKPGSGHGWDNLVQDMKAVADWFDIYLQRK